MLRTYSVVFLLAAACGKVAPQSATQAEVSAVSLTSTGLYSGLLQVTQGSTAVQSAKFAALGKITFMQQYEKMLNATNDASFAIDGVVYQNRHTILQQSRADYAQLQAQYGTFGAYWSAVGFSPVNRSFTAADLRSHLQEVAEEKADSSLGLTAGNIVPTPNTTGISGKSPFANMQVVPNIFSLKCAKQHRALEGLSRDVSAYKIAGKLQQAQTAAEVANIQNTLELACKKAGIDGAIDSNYVLMCYNDKNCSMTDQINVGDITIDDVHGAIDTTATPVDPSSSNGRSLNGSADQ